MTLTNLIYGALRDIGCLRAGQSTSADVLNDCMTAANDMIDSWQIDGLMIFAYLAEIFTLTAGQQIYTIGPTGNFATARPTGIEEANIILNTVTPVVRRQVSLIDVHNWAAIGVRDIPMAIPTVLYYDGNFSQAGNATINLWPGPAYGYQLEIFSNQNLQSFPDLTTNYKFPPGYALCLRKNLAMQIAPMMEIGNKLAGLERPRPALLSLVAKQANDAMATIKSYNLPEPHIKCDAAMLSDSKRSYFNWMDGDTV